MNARILMKRLRAKSVILEAEGSKLHIDAPAGVLTDTLRASLAESKEDLIELLERERARLERAGERGFVACYSKHSGYISLHDPLTGEWHDVKEADCLPGIVEDVKAAKRKRKEGNTA